MKIILLEVIILKLRNNLLFILFLITLFGLSKFIMITPNNNIIEHKDVKIEDLNSILKYKNKYMGNASNTTNLFNSLPLKDYPKTFQLFPDDLTLEINYEDKIKNIGENKVDKALIYNSTAAFALIQNLQQINYNFIDKKYKILRLDVEKGYDVELVELLKKDVWKIKVKDKLEDDKYVDNFINLISQ